jgi:hypothetical protein
MERNRDLQRGGEGRAGMMLSRRKQGPTRVFSCAAPCRCPSFDPHATGLSRGSTPVIEVKFALDSILGAMGEMFLVQNSQRSFGVHLGALVPMILTA